MKLMKFIKNGEPHIKPIGGEWLFKHCSNGRLEVTLTEFEFEVEHLLFMHEVSVLEFIDEVKS